MKLYAFQLGVEEDPPTVVLRFSLASDVEASVRGFDLLRSHSGCEWVVVSSDGEALLRRTRDGGKQRLVWLRGRTDSQRERRPAAIPHQRVAG